MIRQTHNRKSFFKYYTADSALLTLQNTTRKWSSPLIFNDPFDNQFDVHLAAPNKDSALQLVKKFIDKLRSPEPISPNQYGDLTPIYALVKEVHRQNPNFKHSEKEIEDLQEAMLEGMHRAIAKAPQTNVEIRSIMSNVSIFCISETHDNLLMWSHYALNHSGAVIEFLSLPEVDSPLIMAQPVKYSDNMPRLDFDDLMELTPFTRKIIETITLTKSHVWEYEKEWRIISGLRDRAKEYEVLPYAPEEVGAVYLGCKIGADDKNKIIQIIKIKYPNAKIFQAYKHETEFKLVFKNVI